MAEAIASTYADTFERVEKKYRLTAAQYQAVLEQLAKHMELDRYTNTRVTSLYYDTPDDALIERSLEKPLYKEKLRVRMYQPLEGYGEAVGQHCALPMPDQVFVELKKKFKGVVYKRRVAVSAPAAEAFLRGANFERACAAYPLTSSKAQAQALSCKGRQVAREIRAFCQRHPGLRPAMLTVCDRSSWRDPAGQLRVTFDANLKAARPTADPFSFQMAHPVMNLLPEGQVLMEIKQAGALPLWLADCLSDQHIYPQSFSKYGTAHQRQLIRSK